MGLSYDPFDMVDDYLAESAGNRAAFLSQMGQDAKALALMTATIASYLPFPGIGLVGDLALYAMGEQSSMALGFGIALGVIPGGKLLGKLGGFVSKLGASAWRGAKNYAGSFGGFVAKSGSDLMGSLARRAKQFLDRKPRAACGCFAAGTVVWTATAGPVPIEDIQPGEVVLTVDDQTGEVVMGEVVRSIVTEQAAILRLWIVGEDGNIDPINTTDEHPFWVDGQCWTRADQLEPGQELRTVDGTALLISLEFAGERTTVYNFTVSPTNTYLVGDDQVWVHNQSCRLKPKKFINVPGAGGGKVGYLSPDGIAYTGRFHEPVAKWLHKRGLWKSKSSPGKSGWVYGFIEESGYFNGSRLP